MTTVVHDAPIAALATSTGAPGRGLGARWFAERLDGDALVIDLENLELLGAPRRVQDHTISWPGLRQRARQRRHPADMAAIKIDLVEADDAHDPLGAGG